VLKLDIFNHFFPERYFAKLEVIAPAHKDMGKRIRNIPLLRDLDARFRVMDGFGEYQQILSLASPPIEVLAGPRDAIELAQVANDGLADLVRRYPSRFPGFVASLPLNDPAATIAEAERALRDLNACGVQVFTNVNGAPLTSPELLPLFDLMAERNRPIWMHPARGSDFADYRTEKESKFEIWWTFGWPYETSVAMARMVFADTALFGAAAGTACGLDFFGVDRVLFASDTPFEPQPGLYIRETVDIIDRLPISDAERAQIYAGNAQRLLKLGA
jgi:aminocarboxymuconate-semialdehyde decarboxylase